MFDKTEFYKAAGSYFGVPSDVTITDIDESATYYEGCPTCGGDMEYEVHVAGTHADGKRYYKTFYGTLADFIRSL